MTLGKIPLISTSIRELTEARRGVVAFLRELTELNYTNVNIRFSPNQPLVVTHICLSSRQGIAVRHHSVGGTPTTNVLGSVARQTVQP